MFWRLFLTGDHAATQLSRLTQEIEIMSQSLENLKAAVIAASVAQLASVRKIADLKEEVAALRTQIDGLQSQIANSGASDAELDAVRGQIEAATASVWSGLITTEPLPSYLEHADEAAVPVAASAAA